MTTWRLGHKNERSNEVTITEQNAMTPGEAIDVVKANLAAGEKLLWIKEPA